MLASMLASMLALAAMIPMEGAESRATLDIAGCQLSSDGNKLELESSCKLTSSVETSSEQMYTKQKWMP